MRKTLLILLCALCILCLIGCNVDPTTTEPPTEAPTATPTDAPTEPPVTEPPETEPEPTDPVLDETKLYGIDVTGMTAAQAKEAIQNSINNYKLVMTVNGKALTFTGSGLSMTLNEEVFNKWFEEAIAGNQPSTAGLIDCNVDSAVKTIEESIGKKAENAKVTYNKTTKSFTIQTHKDGLSVDTAPARSALISAINTLSPAHSVTLKTTTVPATINDQDPRLPGIVSSANEYLALKISYTYQASGIPTTTEAISTDSLASFVTVDENLNIKFDSLAIQNYISTMRTKNGGSEKRAFQTSYGTTTNLTVEYYSVVLDETSMYHDLLSCLENKLSGNRTAKFLPVEETNMAYGGSYVEIDLDNQCLWLYKNGNLIIKSPLVSGNVSTGYRTRNGVFSIYGKTRGTYLTGPTWRSYVDYWMPFNGGVGLHDASWRSSFGGTTYIYDGSHGCINLPPKNAATIYNNVSIGTKVIVYGGATTAGALTQEFTGTSSYELSVGDAPFKLDVKAKYTGAAMSYKTSNANVVTVDAEGNVTVVGAGTATITVSTEKLGSLKAGTFEISVVVTGEPVPTEPTPTEPTPTEPTPTEPQPTEPAPTEPTPTEPQPTEPDPSESTTEPEPTDFAHDDIF